MGNFSTVITIDFSETTFSTSDTFTVTTGEGGAGNTVTGVTYNELANGYTFIYDTLAAISFIITAESGGCVSDPMVYPLTTPAPVTPAPVTPAPTTPAPTTPAPTTPNPVVITPAPTTPAPVTPAPTTPAPTPLEGYIVRYDEFIDLDACASTDPTITIYSNCDPITTPVGGTTCRLYYDPNNLTSYVSGGYYADTTTSAYYYVEGNGNGIVQEVGSCPTPNPIPLSTPAPVLPCVEIQMQTTGVSSSGLACGSSGAPMSGRSIRSGQLFPVVGDTIYGRDCVAAFDGGNLWYYVPDDTSVIRISASGEVVEKLSC